MIFNPPQMVEFAKCAVFFKLLNLNRYHHMQIAKSIKAELADR